MFNPQRILVPTDFSEYSHRAYAEALGIAEHYGSEIILLHVIHEGLNQKQLFFLDDDKVAEIQRIVIKSAQEELDAFLAKHPPLQADKVHCKILEGAPYNMILKEIKESRVDLVIVGSHGRNAFEEILYGSTTEKVVRHARCSVMVVK